MNKSLIKYYILMFFAFMIDSVLSYFFPSDFTMNHVLVVPYISLIAFALINNRVSDDSRYVFATICGAYYAIIYSQSNYLFIIFFIFVAFFGNRYTKKSSFNIFEALLCCFLTIFAREVVVYLMAMSIGEVHLAILTYLVNRLIPTLIFNVLMVAPLFLIYQKIGSEGEANEYYI